MRRLLLSLLTLASGAAGIAACSSDPQPGLRVDVDPATFGDAVSMTVVIRAIDVGFVMREAKTIDGVRVTTEDTDGDGIVELKVRFNGPFDRPFSFRVETGNTANLSMHADAMAFDNDDMIAAGSGDAELPAGGEGSVSLTLATTTSPIGANTRTTDLSSGAVDVNINGSMADAHPNALAVCDLDGDTLQDIVIGAPDDAADGRPLGSTGAVYVIWGSQGGFATGTTIDIAAHSANEEFHFYGRDSGDRLGAAVACANIDGDDADDLIVGAPGADGGHGRVYVVFGRINFKAVKSVDLSSVTATGVDVEFTTAAPSAGLGSVLFAADMNGDRHAEILASAPGVQQVHLFPSPAKPDPTPIVVDADLADHVVFTGAPIAAIGAGDLDQTPPLDVVLGDPTHRESSDTGSRRGAAYVFAGVDPTTSNRYDVASASRTAIGRASDAQLGAAVLIGDTSGQGEDLYLGAPGDGDVGVVYLFPHDSEFFLASTFDLAGTDTQKITGYEPSGRFGSSLAVARAGINPPVALRLAVGAPGVDRPQRMAAGAAYLYKADGGRKFRIFEQVYGAGTQHALGTAVAGGLLDGGDTKGDLVVAAPGATGSVAGSGVVYVRFGQ